MRIVALRTYVNAFKYAKFCLSVRITYACEALRTMYAYDSVCA